MNIVRFLLAVLMLFAFVPAQAGQPGYQKMPDSDGKSKRASQQPPSGRWINVQNVAAESARKGAVLMGVSESGRQYPITKDGRYKTRDGKMIIIINGKVASVQ